MNIFKKYFKKLKDTLDFDDSKKYGTFIEILNYLVVVALFVYIYLRFRYINAQIPFWFTTRWGDAMFASKKFLYLLPITSGLILLGAKVFLTFFKNHFVRFLDEILLLVTTLTNFLLTISAVQIIYKSSVPFPPLINPTVLSLLVPFILAFIITYSVVPFFINYAKSIDLVTNPKIHSHPGMLLQSPSTRGGGSLYALLFLVLSLAFVGFQIKLSGFYIAVLMLGVLGFADDFQNTHVRSSFKVLENPVLRLLLMFSAVAVLVVSGVEIKTIGNPLGGFFDLSNIKIAFFSYIVTALWVVWVLNLLSWSNGIDGQYGGIIGIASIFICILSLRFSPLLAIHRHVAIMAAISAGISFGFTKYTWYPSSLMWGFGATAAGLVIASLSILINTKILVSVLFLLIPFLDASVTFVRRILQKKSPLKGDRGHFHHLLLDMGWSVPKIAKFYWGTTLIFGLIGVFGSDKILLRTVLIAGGLVAFFIVLVNLKALKRKEEQPTTV